MMMTGMVPSYFSDMSSAALLMSATLGLPVPSARRRYGAMCDRYQREISMTLPDCAPVQLERRWQSRISLGESDCAPRSGRSRYR